MCLVVAVPAPWVSVPACRSTSTRPKLAMTKGRRRHDFPWFLRWPCVLFFLKWDLPSELDNMFPNSTLLITFFPKQLDHYTHVPSSKFTSALKARIDDRRRGTRFRWSSLSYVSCRRVLSAILWSFFFQRSSCSRNSLLHDNSSCWTSQSRDDKVSVLGFGHLPAIRRSLSAEVSFYEW